MLEEWYTLKNHAKDLHVLLIHEPGLKGNMYDRPAYPATWAHLHGQGRVFYTSMGHREERSAQSHLPVHPPGRTVVGVRKCESRHHAEHRKGNPQYLTVGKEDPPKVKKP